MSDDLLRRLDAPYASEHNGPLCHQAARRIRELEAQLADALALPEIKALVEALRAIAETSNYTRASWMQDTARAALASLTTAPVDASALRGIAERDAQ